MCKTLIRNMQNKVIYKEEKEGKRESCKTEQGKNKKGKREYYSEEDKNKKRGFVSFICIGYLLAFGCNRVGKVSGILFVRSTVSRPNNC